MVMKHESVSLRLARLIVWCDMMFVIWYSVVLVLLRQAGKINASARWPKGYYGLLKPNTGCPEQWKDRNWEQNCWIDQDTLNYGANEKSKLLHIDGNVDDSSVKRYFCSKTTWTGPTWPEGQYCIYSSYGIQEMQTGSIRMHNQLYNNRDSISPSCKNDFVDIFNSYSYKYIDLYFQCYTSGNKNRPISLPISKPFYLLPYGSRDCQQVKWMVATSEWIKYHTRNYEGYYYFQGRGEKPHHELGASSSNRGITMYYCYYKSCNYTLKDKKGVFQSPGFPGKYPDGQLCSWRIMVPDNHTLHIHFTNFSMYEYDKDCLQLYEKENRIFKLKQAFFGHHPLFTITATRDSMFVFRSDEERNSNGFRAEYEIFKTPERTTTVSPKPPTTTAHPTTKLKTTQLPTTKQLTTKLPTSKQPTTTEALTTFALPTTNVNSTKNDTLQCKPVGTKDKPSSQRLIDPLKKTCFCDETWRIVVMVIPLAVFILILLVIIDIICRCRSRKDSKNGSSGSSADSGMVVNPTYGRGNINLGQPADTVTDSSTVNTADDQPQPRDDLPDYEDLDYTQIDEIPPPRRSTKRQECLVLEPVGNDTSSVFYHVWEPSKIESDGPQCHVREPIGNGAPREFDHTLESPSDLNRPTYQNLPQVNHFILNPVYKPADNSVVSC